MATGPTLHVQIVTPERSAFDGSASEVVVPAWDGELGVYPQHDALLCLLRAGTFKVWGSDGLQTFIVGRGFAEIGPDRVTVLTDSAETLDGVDVDQARKDLAHAEAELAVHEDSSEKHNQAQILYELARARLQL